MKVLVGISGILWEKEKKISDDPLQKQNWLILWFITTAKSFDSSTLKRLQYYSAWANDVLPTAIRLIVFIYWFFFLVSKECYIFTSINRLAKSYYKHIVVDKRTGLSSRFICSACFKRESSLSTVYSIYKKI